MSDRYILEEKTPVRCDDLMAWARWMEKEDRSVALTRISNTIQVSTVFLGLDHGPGGVPVLFETMVFGGPLDEEMDRYTTWDEAKKGHKAMCKKVAP